MTSKVPRGCGAASPPGFWLMSFATSKKIADTARCSRLCSLGFTSVFKLGNQDGRRIDSVCIPKRSYSPFKSTTIGITSPNDPTDGLTVKEIEQAPHNFSVQCLGEGLCCKCKRIQPFAREHRGDQATEIRYPNHRISFIRARRSYRSNLRVFRAALFVRVKDGEEVGRNI
jgi:hypothetical protein